MDTKAVRKKPVGAKTETIPEGRHYFTQELP